MLWPPFSMRTICRQKSPVASEETTGNGGPEEDRTLDLRVANAALSQLSYKPLTESIIALFLAKSRQNHRFS